MRIEIVGGGPGGLFFAYLAKRDHPGAQVIVHESNTADATYGWGVVFAGHALRFLKEVDAPFYEDFTREHVLYNDMEVVHRGEHVVIRNNAFSRVGRLTLLRTLHRHCERVGVELRFLDRIDDFDALDAADLIVGADGVGSRYREHFAARFKPTVTQRPNFFAWYGTPRLFEKLALIFRQNEHGIFIAHTYQYDAALSTFLVECDPESFRRAGLDRMDDDAARAYVERVFAEDLGGHPVLSNRAGWFNARFVRTERMSADHRVLIGDALRTVHFSIGAGTRMAMIDAIGLAAGLRAHPTDVRAALAHFESNRRDASNDFQAAAEKSLDWYETVATRMHLDPWAFAYSYYGRTGRLTLEDMHRIDPEFVAAIQRHSPAIAGGPPPP